MTNNEFDKERKYLMALMINSDNFFKDFGKIDDDAFSEGNIPKKYKESTMLTVSIVSKCKECIEYHIKECLNANTNKNEIMESN